MDPLTNFLQLTANGVFTGLAYGALGAGFALILGVTGRFHFAYALTYTATVYFAYSVLSSLKFPFWVAALFGVAVSTVLSVLIELIVYRPVARRAGPAATMAIFVAALGVGTAGISIIQLIWGTAGLSFYGPELIPIEISGVTFTNFAIFQALTSVVVVVGLTLLLRFTSVGRSIIATRGNPDLARVMGINPERVFLIVFALGGAIAGVEAIWSGLMYTADSSMGDRSIIYAFVVAFLAGTTRSPIRALFVGLALGLLEQWASIFMSVQWTQNTVFVILVVYLLLLSSKGKIRPLQRKPAKPVVKEAAHVA